MLLTSALIDDIRRRLARGDFAVLRRIKPAAITLGASLELACSMVHGETTNEGLTRSLIEEWPRKLPLVEEAAALLSGVQGRPFPFGHFDAPKAELHVLRTRDDLIGTAWDLYRQRFQRSLVAQGFSKQLSTALSKALYEMADNVVQHSGPDVSKPAPGLVGYHVGTRWMDFAVADLGRGVLASLRSNPHWRSLPDSMEALEAAVSRRASRREVEAEGSGFRQVHKSMANLNGHLRFRSGDGVLTLDGRGGSQQARLSSSPLFPGFQLTVSCGLDGNVGGEQGDTVEEHPLPDVL